MFEVLGMVALGLIAMWFAYAGFGIIVASLIFDKNRTGAVIGLFFIGAAGVLASTLASHISISVT